MAEQNSLQFGKYRLLERLAVGRMAEIWHGSVGTARGPQPVVIKLIRSELCGNADFMARFVDEARVASMLEHPNIARVHEWGSHQGRLFIAMEYIEGTNLAALMQAEAERGGRFPPTLGIYIMTQVLSALEYAHRLTDAYGNPSGLVHRDVTPPNIVISSNGKVKLVDFGLARVASKLTATMPGLFRGKLAYLAPEVLAGRPIDGRADLFSVGMVLYEILTGLKLPEASGPLGHPAIEQVRHKPPSSVYPDVPVELDQLILSATEADPANRPHSATEFKQRLSDFLQRWDRRADDQALSAFLRELASGGTGHDKKNVGFAFGEATSQWMASGEDLEKLVPLAGGSGEGSNQPVAPADPLQEIEDTAPPSFSAPRGKFSGGETVMAIKESGLGKGRTLRNLLLVLLALGAIAAVAFLLLRSLGGREEKLASRKVKEAKAKLAAPLFIELSPPDAAILVDGEPVQPAGTPPRIEGLSAGEHTFRVLAPGYLPVEKKVVLGTKSNDTLRVELEPRIGELKVKTTPRGALVWVDGRRRGKTPLVVKGIETGKEHEIVIKKLRFKPVKLKIGPADWPEDPGKPLVVEKRLKRVRRRRRR